VSLDTASSAAVGDGQIRGDAQMIRVADDAGVVPAPLTILWQIYGKFRAIAPTFNTRTPAFNALPPRTGREQRWVFVTRWFQGPRRSVALCHLFVALSLCANYSSTAHTRFADISGAPIFLKRHRGRNPRSFRQDAAAVAAFAQHTRKTYPADQHEEFCVFFEVDERGVPRPPVATQAGARAQRSGVIHSTLPTKLSVPMGAHVQSSWLLSIDRMDVQVHTGMPIVVACFLRTKHSLWLPRIYMNHTY
jgi:hypothetical protein